MSVIPADVDISALGVYNAKFYGALGDGSTDDTSSIQLAINAAYEAGGGIVYLPGGKYVINGGDWDLPTLPGGTDGVYRGIGPIPNIPNTSTPYPLIDLTTANDGLPSGGHATVLPNGPILLFENVTLVGDGPELTVLLAGEGLYDGYMLAPGGGLGNARQSGTVVATVNWWADYDDGFTDDGPFADGFFAHNVFVRDLSIDCQGKQCANAGKPLLVFDGDDPVDNADLAPSFVSGVPAGLLNGAALTLHCTENCGVDNVWVYNGNINGILIEGTQNLDAHANGPITQSYQQTTGTVYPLPNLEISVPSATGAPFGTPSVTNVPAMHASVTRCRVDMNYPMWLAGTQSKVAGHDSGHGWTGGSHGQYPIRCVGAADVTVTHNRIGQRNQPSDFVGHTPPSTSLFPDVGPNTSDGLNCPGCWHILIANNSITNCGDAIGAAGNGDMIITNNVLYNFGSNGVDMIQPNNADPPQAKGPSQTVITGNTFFLSSDSGAAQQGINYEDLTTTASGSAFGSGTADTSQQYTSQQGDLIISDNLFYASNISTFCGLQGWGIIVRGNIFDFAGLTPQGQPLAANFLPGMNDASDAWPLPSGSGVNILGNDIIVEGNIFRNAGPAGVPNSGVIGVHFLSTFPPTLAGTDKIRILVKGNIFDETIGSPIVNAAASSALLGVRILDNVGINPTESLDPSLVATIPGSGATFENPYPYDCYVNVASSSSTISVALNGVAFASIASGQQKSFLVKAGGSIKLTYGISPAPSWVWVGL